MEKVKILEIKQSVFANNDAQADKLRQELKAKGIYLFAQVFPLFQDASVFTTIPALYADGFMDAAVRPTLVNPVPQGVISIASLAINVLVLAIIIKRSIQQKNPYRNEIFTDTKDFQLAMDRAE